MFFISPCCLSFFISEWATSISPRPLTLQRRWWWATRRSARCLWRAPPRPSSPSSPTRRRRETPPRSRGPPPGDAEARSAKNPKASARPGSSACTPLYPKVSRVGGRRREVDGGVRRGELCSRVGPERVVGRLEDFSVPEGAITLVLQSLSFPSLFV